MGLDMYLNKKTYIGGQYEHNAIGGVIELTKKGKRITINLKKLEYVEETQAYWRKANQIHKRFVENVQFGDDDCGHYIVNKEQLEDLVELCKKVLASLEKQELVEKEIDDRYNKGKKVKVMVYPNVDLAIELLPHQEGFFFGSETIDEYYVEDLKNTIEQLSDLSYEYDYYYHSSR